MGIFFPVGVLCCPTGSCIVDFKQKASAKWQLIIGKAPGSAQVQDVDIAQL